MRENRGLTAQQLYLAKGRERAIFPPTTTFHSDPMDRIWRVGPGRDPLFFVTCAALWRPGPRKQDRECSKRNHVVWMSRVS
jgi:hypothetical protein